MRPGDRHERPTCRGVGQVIAERGVPDLGVRALQLAPRRGDAARDVLERQVAGVLAIHDRDGVREETRAQLDRGGTLGGHCHEIRAERPERMSRGGVEGRIWRVAAHLDVRPPASIGLCQSSRANEPGR